MNVCECLMIGAKLFPDKEAVVFEGQSFTYQQLERLSARAAAALRIQNVQPGDRVGIVLPNGPAFAVWYYGCLRLGGVAVSISTRLAAAEVDFILDDCGAKAVVVPDTATPSLPDETGPARAQVLRVSEHTTLGADDAFSGAEPLRLGEYLDTEPDAAAAILYTSGTTGFPKGATLSHGNIRATVFAFNHLCEMRPRDRLLLAVPLFHCYGQNALLNAGFNVGATLVMQRKFDLNESKKLIATQKITKLFGVPTTFQLMSESCDPADLESVEYSFSAAATMPPQLAKRWRQKFGMPVYEGYGLTETAPFASYNHRLKFLPGSIGMPVDSVEMKIVDPDTGEDCPPQTPGEIAIRGPNVMLGYWNRPNETAEVIRDGWFHSGDIGFKDEDGYYFIVDRLKDMISVGGMKVFPAEVERVLLDHPSIVEAAVVGFPDEVLGERVVAFVVLDGKNDVDAGEIESYCERQIGSFKRPKQIVFVDELPRNPAGKVLKIELRERKLPDCVSSPSTIESNGRAFSPLFERLSDVHPSERLREVTSVIQSELRDVVGAEETALPDAMLVDQGLDSLLIVELRDRLQRHVGAAVELPATLVFDQPRIRDLAAYLLETVSTQPPAVGIETTEVNPSAAKAGGRALPEVEKMTEEEALDELLRELSE